jgi:hypothetical protein
MVGSVSDWRMPSSSMRASSDDLNASATSPSSITRVQNSIEAKVMKYRRVSRVMTDTERHQARQGRAQGAALGWSQPFKKLFRVSSLTSKSIEGFRRGVMDGHEVGKRIDGAG